MSPLVTPEVIASLTKRSFTDTDRDAVEQIIEMIEGELRSYVNRPLTPTAFLAEKITLEDGFLATLNTPVLSVQALRLSSTGSAYTGSYTITSGGLRISDETGTGPDYEVDYTAGVWPDQSGVLKSLVASRVTRVLAKVQDDATGVRTLTQEGYTAAYLDEGWTDQELKLADRLRRRTAVR